MGKDNLIISIGRECGSGGHEIGEKLAAHYDIPLYDRNILKVLAEKTGQNAEGLSKIEEKVTGPRFPFFKRGTFAEQQGGLMNKISSSDVLFMQERALIEEMAEKGDSFVIMGRAANYILADNPSTLHLFVYAPEEFKIPRVKEFYHLDTDAEARKRMLYIDKVRRDYFHYYTNMVWASTDGHDLMINSSILGIDGTVEMIIEMAERKRALAAAAPEPAVSSGADEC